MEKNLNCEQVLKYRFLVNNQSMTLEDKMNFYTLLSYYDYDCTKMLCDLYDILL